MKIAVFGFYNSLNAGDDRLQYCITKMLRDLGTVVFLPHNSPPPVDYLKTFDWILIGGGGLVFQRHGIWANMKQWMSKVSAKIGIIGLGINHLPSDLASELSDLLDRATFFYVRDKDSKALLNNDPRVEVHPDLSWCFPLKEYDLESTVKSNSVALNLFPCSWKDLNCQQWIEELSNFTINPFPLCFLPNRDFDLLQQYYGDRVVPEFSLQPLRSSELVVACRYHALIFAMQFKKPFVAINYDLKVERLLQESNLSECLLETTEYSKIQEKIEYVTNNQEHILDKIESYNRHQISQAHTMKQKVRAFIANTSDLSLEAFNLKQKMHQIAKLIIS